MELPEDFDYKNAMRQLLVLCAPGRAVHIELTGLEQIPFKFTSYRTPSFGTEAESYDVTQGVLGEQASAEDEARRDPAETEEG